MTLNMEQQNLAAQHQHLVATLVNQRLRRCPSHVERGDFTGAAAIALARAAATFDASRGVPFEVFAATKIRWAITDAQRDIDTMTRAERRKQKAGGAAVMPRIEISLDAAAADPGLAHAGGHRPVEHLDLLAAMRELPPVERAVLRLTFVDDMTNAEVATRMGLSAGRISQIKGAGIARLRLLMLKPAAWLAVQS